MDRRCSFVEFEHLRVLGPIKALFAGLESPPFFSLGDAIADIIDECHAGTIDMDISELEGIITSCDEHAADRKGFGEPTNLNQPEISSLAMYTSEFIEAERSFFAVLNLALRSAQRRLVKPFVKAIWLLMHALKNCPIFEGSSLFRGTNKLLEGYVKGRKVTWNQFSSCSCDLSVQQNLLDPTGNRTILQIDITTKRARLISDFSVHPDEQEVILPPNTRLEVVEVLDEEDGLRIIHLRELPPTDPILDFSAKAQSIRVNGNNNQQNNNKSDSPRRAEAAAPPPNGSSSSYSSGQAGGHHGLANASTHAPPKGGGYGGDYESQTGFGSKAQFNNPNSPRGVGGGIGGPAASTGYSSVAPSTSFQTSFPQHGASPKAGSGPGAGMGTGVPTGNLPVLKAIPAAKLSAFLRDDRTDGASPEEAEQCLRQCGGNVSAAIQMFLDSKQHGSGFSAASREEKPAALVALAGEAMHSIAGGKRGQGRTDKQSDDRSHGQQQHHQPQQQHQTQPHQPSQPLLPSPTHRGRPVPGALQATPSASSADPEPSPRPSPRPTPRPAAGGAGAGGEEQGSTGGGNSMDDPELINKFIKALKQVPDALQSQPQFGMRLALQAFTGLYSLAGDVNKSEALGQAGVCPLLVAILASPFVDTPMAERGLKAVGKLARLKANRVRMGDAGACEVVVQLMKNHGSSSANLGGIGCQVVSYMAVELTNSQKFGAADVFNVIVDVMQVHGCEAAPVGMTVYQAFSALANDPANKVKIGEAQGNELMLNIMKVHGTENPKLAIRAIECMIEAMRGCDANRRILAELGVSRLAASMSLPLDTEAKLVEALAANPAAAISSRNTKGGGVGGGGAVAVRVEKKAFAYENEEEGSSPGKEQATAFDGGSKKLVIQKSMKQQQSFKQQRPVDDDDF